VEYDKKEAYAFYKTVRQLSYYLRAKPFIDEEGPCTISPSRMKRP
jgi:hypothetical protein